MLNPQALGARLRLARQQRRVTQKELSARLGVPQSQLSRWETGSSALTLMQAAALAEHLQLSLDVWLSGDEATWSAALAGASTDQPASGVAWGYDRLSGRPFRLQRQAGQALVLVGAAGAGKSYAQRLELARWCASGRSALVVDLRGDWPGAWVEAQDGQLLKHVEGPLPATLCVLQPSSRTRPPALDGLEASTLVVVDGLEGRWAGWTDWISIQLAEGRPLSLLARDLPGGELLASLLDQRLGLWSPDPELLQMLGEGGLAPELLQRAQQQPPHCLLLSGSGSHQWVDLRGAALSEWEHRLLAG